MSFATRANCDPDFSSLRQVAINQGAKTLGDLATFIALRRYPHHPLRFIAVRPAESRQHSIHRCQIFSQLSQSYNFTLAEHRKFAWAKRIRRGPAAKHTVIDAEFLFFPTIEVEEIILIHLSVELDWGIRRSRFPFERPALTFWAAAGLKLTAIILSLICLCLAHLDPLHHAFKRLELAHQVEQLIDAG